MKRTTDGRFVEERIIVNKNVLRSLMNSVKKKNKFTWKELGKNLGVSPQTVQHDWFRDNRTLPLSIFKKLILLSEKNKNYNFKSIGPFWGQKLIKGKPKLKEVNLPDKKETDFAEFYGILLGDGCIMSDLKGFSITGDKYLDYNYYIYYLNNLIKRLFKAQPKIYLDKKKRVIRCIFYSKKVIQYLVNAGFPVGIKYNKNLEIPSYIFKNKKSLATCIRGIMDTDGSLSAHPNVKIMIHLSITIDSLRKSVHKGLISLGIKGGIFNKGIMIYGIEKIDKFHKTIGFSNFKNKYKYGQFKKTGKVPSSKAVEMFIKSKMEI